jgi:hypothetical protein
MNDDPSSPPDHRAPVDVEAAGEVRDRLPLVVTVGFTGHRTIENAAEADRLIAHVFTHVGEAFDQIAASPLAEAYDGAPRLRLLIGEAPGADRVAAQVWREQDLGEIHSIYPFKDPTGRAAFTDRPEKDDPETRVATPPEFGPWTGIDSAGLGLASDRAHAEVGRWIVRHCDVLIGWWNGKPGQGVGGTNDTMERALERGLPVIWLHPGDATLRLIDPHASRRHADASEAMLGLEELAQPLTAGALAELLRPAFTPPGDATAHFHDPEVAARIDYAAVDPLKIPPGVRRLFNHTLWRSYRLFERLAGGQPPLRGRNSPPPEGLIEQPGFTRLRAALSEAGARANQLSNIHRSEQLLLIVLAVLAVLVGALPSLLTAEFTPSSPGQSFAAAAQTAARASATVHAYCAAAEFCLGLLAILVVSAARRSHRHRRWSDARRLAERLRGACATWPLGIDVADAHVDPPQTWTEWRVRAVLRAAGPRRGWITRDRFERTAAWVAEQLIDSQILYHARQHRVAERIERMIRRIENGSFLILMVTLGAYVIAVALQRSTGWVPPQPVSGLVTLLSAVTPAIGAGCLALDATNGFGEIALHSARLRVEFERRKAELGAGAGAGTEYHHVQAVIRSAAQLLRDENDAWRDSLLRRRIVRG